MNKSLKGILKIVVDILTAFIFILLMIIIFTKVSMLYSGKDYFEIFGYSIFKIATGSMEPAISENDIIIVKKSDNYKVSDIITYKSDNAYITHRIISINDNTIIARGDANNASDRATDISTVIGKVIKIYKNLGIWQKIFTTPKILITIFLTLILFDFAFSYKSKDTTLPKKSKKSKPEIKNDDMERLVNEITAKVLESLNNKENIKPKEATEILDMTFISEPKKDVEKLSKKELEDLSEKLDNLDNEYTFKDLSQKEKDFIECTMRLDLTKLEDVVNNKIEWK